MLDLQDFRILQGLGLRNPEFTKLTALGSVVELWFRFRIMRLFGGYGFQLRFEGLVC